MSGKMTVEIKKIGKAKHMVVTIPMIERVSKSGKTILVATTGGNVETGLEFKGEEISIGLNAYIPNTEDE